MQSNMPRLRDAQSGSGEQHSAHWLLPGIFLKTLATESGSLRSTKSLELSLLPKPEICGVSLP